MENRSALTTESQKDAIQRGLAGIPWRRIESPDFLYKEQFVPANTITIPSAYDPKAAHQSSFLKERQEITIDLNQTGTTQTALHDVRTTREQ